MVTLPMETFTSPSEIWTWAAAGPARPTDKAPATTRAAMFRCIHFISLISLPPYRFRVLHGSKRQDPSDEVDNGKRMGKRYAIADDQEICKKARGPTLSSS